MHQPYRVLCVCLGNICRSPTAEAILKHHIADLGLNIEVDSAGTSNYHPNKAPDRRSQKYAKHYGYDLSKLRARQIHIDDFAKFDLILAMDDENLKEINALHQVAKKQLGTEHIKADIALMSQWDALFLKQAVPDPYYGEQEDFERVIVQCESSAKAWIMRWQQQNIGLK